MKKIKYVNMEGAYYHPSLDEIFLDKDLQHFSILHDYAKQHELFHAWNRNKFWRNMKFEIKSFVAMLGNPSIYDELMRYNDYKHQKAKKLKEIVYCALEDLIISICSFIYVPIALYRWKIYQQKIKCGFKWLFDEI